MRAAASNRILRGEDLSSSQWERRAGNFLFHNGGRQITETGIGGKV